MLIDIIPRKSASTGDIECGAHGIINAERRLKGIRLRYKINGRYCDGKPEGSN